MQNAQDNFAREAMFSKSLYSDSFDLPSLLEECFRRHTISVINGDVRCLGGLLRLAERRNCAYLVARY
jgi:hypothetical protein